MAPPLLSSWPLIGRLAAARVLIGWCWRWPASPASLPRMAESRAWLTSLSFPRTLPSNLVDFRGEREWWSRIRLQWAILGSIGPAPAATASTQLIYPLCSETLQLIVVKKSQTSVVMMSSMLGQQPLSPGNLKAMCPSSAMSAQHHIICHSYSFLH